MSKRDLFDHKALALQAIRQKKYAWDLEKDIHWEQGVDLNRFLLPLDKDAYFFPGANPKQQLALSQILGLFLNTTVAELEDAINNMKFTAWKQILRSYPVGPEMEELGELFFEEEKKHADAFNRYTKVFCESMGIKLSSLNHLLPKAFGSPFLEAIKLNARMGGHAVWWVVAGIEEVSLEIFRDLAKHKDNIDPLFFEVHFKHMEEESRHHNYAFLMLDIIERRRTTVKRFINRRTDLVVGQLCNSTWLITELMRLLEAKRFAHEHDFFATIASCEPLFKTLGWGQLLKKIFVTSPYLSKVINTKNHKISTSTAQKHRALNFPFPKPNVAETTSVPQSMRLLPPQPKKKKNASPNSRKRAS